MKYHNKGSQIELNIHDGTVRDVTFMKSLNYESHLVSGGAGNCIVYLTDCATQQTMRKFDAHKGKGWWNAQVL